MRVFALLSPSKARYILGAVLSLCLIQPSAYAESTIQDERVEYFESKKYKRLCKKLQRRFGLYQSEKAMAGEEPKVVCRIPPQLPDECARRAKSEETVNLIYDITREGHVENIRLVETTNQCLVQSAADSVYYSQYEETATGAKDIEAAITYRLE